MSILSNIFSRDEINIPLPEMFRIVQPYTYLVYSFAIILLLSFLLKILNKGENLKKAIIASLSILVMYFACVVIYTYEPAGLQEYLAPLPFVELEGQTLSLALYKFTADGKPNIPSFCSEVASMFLLAFLVNQIYSFKPGNLKTPGWLVFRFFSTIFCIGVHFAAYKVLQKVIGMVPGDSFLKSLLPYLPIGILCFVLFIFILGCIKSIMKHFLKVVNPTFEGLYGFFYVNKFGIIVTRAIWSTLILTVFAFGLQQKMEEVFRVASISIAPPPGLSGTLILIGLFFVWMVIGQSL